MTDERDVWVKLTPDPGGDSPNRGTPTVSFRPLALIGALLLGWVALVLVLRVLLPASTKPTEALRGGVYLAYLVVAAIMFARSIKKTKAT